MALLALRHVAFEDLGAFEAPLAAAGHAIRYHDVPQAGLSGLDPLGPDLLAILGGPIGACDEALYPFVAEETRFIGARLAARRPTLGICLGAQMMARALGAKVYPGRGKEIGFAPLDAARGLLAGYEGVPVLHWHGDVFDLPAGAERLASTALCENQAFRLSDFALGFQCHPEARPEGFEFWLVGHAAELAGAGISPVALRRQMAEYGPASAARGQAMIAEWLSALPV
jgi:GMP synthase (glutamine-hydrolysing)